mmetsp:Transcript_27260/g.70739  ORF Transcript_27260/g.70739 Transcript_27260/m.70739 type:complete len:317 (+) Transcript_27260:147-1097(+)
MRSLAALRSTMASGPPPSSCTSRRCVSQLLYCVRHVSEGPSCSALSNAPSAARAESMGSTSPVPFSANNVAEEPPVSDFSCDTSSMAATSMWVAASRCRPSSSKISPHSRCNHASSASTACTRCTSCMCRVGSPLTGGCGSAVMGARHLAAKFIRYEYIAALTVLSFTSLLDRWISLSTFMRALTHSFSRAKRAVISSTTDAAPCADRPAGSSSPLSGVGRLALRQAFPAALALVMLTTGPVTASSAACSIRLHASKGRPTSGRSNTWAQDIRWRPSIGLLSCMTLYIVLSACTASLATYLQAIAFSSSLMPWSMC